jgi:anti-anti-sigma factor
MRHACSFSQPTIEVRFPQPHTALVVLRGEHDLSSVDELRRTIDQSFALCDHLIVDLSAVEFIDSTTIRALLETRQRAIELDCTFSIALGDEAIVQRVLEVSGVLPLLNVVPTVEQALDALASRHPDSVTLAG